MLGRTPPQRHPGDPTRPGEVPRGPVAQGDPDSAFGLYGQELQAIRNTAMLLTFLDTGSRLGELVRLNLEDVMLRDQSIRQAKNGRERAVFMGRKLFLASKGRNQRIRRRHRSG